VSSGKVVRERCLYAEYWGGGHTNCLPGDWLDVEIDDQYGGSKRQMKVYIGVSRHEFNLRKDGVLSVGGVLFLTTLSGGRI
jgi:hypothetical protein